MSYFCRVRRCLPVLFCAAWMLAFGLAASAAEDPPVILAFGDSLTAGFMVNGNESYPARLQKILREQGYPHKVVNAGVSGDTTAGGAARIEWLLKQKPEIVIVELGANDGLRGLPIEEIRRNLAFIIATCQKEGAKVLLAGMRLPPNLGDDYTRAFAALFPELAEKYHVPLIPFFLEGVAGVRDLTLPDGIHPVAKGYEIVTQTVWRYLEPMLKASSTS